MAKLGSFLPFFPLGQSHARHLLGSGGARPAEPNQRTDDDGAASPNYRLAFIPISTSQPLLEVGLIETATKANRPCLRQDRFTQARATWG